MHFLSRPAPPPPRWTRKTRHGSSTDHSFRFSSRNCHLFLHLIDGTFFCCRWPGAIGVMTHNAASLLSNQVGMRTWISGQCLHFVICWVCFLKVLKVNVTCFTCFITCFKVVDGFGSLHDFCFHTAIRWLWTCLQILQELDLATQYKHWALRVLIEIYCAFVHLTLVLLGSFSNSGGGSCAKRSMLAFCSWKLTHLKAFKTFPMLSISFDQRKYISVLREGGSSWNLMPRKCCYLQ